MVGVVIGFFIDVIGIGCFVIVVVGRCFILLWVEFGRFEVVLDLILVLVLVIFYVF